MNAKQLLVFVMINLITTFKETFSRLIADHHLRVYTLLV